MRGDGHLHARWKASSTNVRGEHGRSSAGECHNEGGHSERKIHRRIVDPFVYFVDEYHGFHHQFGGKHADQFDRARSAVKEGIEVEARNVSH
eukprot:475731-Pleurochrysis_carterae.AAC.1